MNMETSGISDKTEGTVLHVVVVGFHHKKGCQVEYSYPPLIDGDKVDSHECPEEWKNLPSLALPDGSHNYEQDTIYFLMPAKGDVQKTVFCISCYRQMNAEDLLNRSADITRGTVQKSVCVISTLPLFGLIQAKLELITHAYFDERDFSKVSLLEDTYNNLNACLSGDLVNSQQVFLGMSARDLVSNFKHKVLLLFKLILLEKKILFFKTPVKMLCSNVLALLSLFPGMIECGLENAANVSTQIVISDTHPSDHEDNNKSNIEFSIENKAKYSPGCEMKSNLDAVTPENKNKIDSQVPVKIESNDDFSQKNNQYFIADDNLDCLSSQIECKKNNFKTSVNLDKIPSLDGDNDPQFISEIEELLDGESKEKPYPTRPKLEFNCKDLDLSDAEEKESNLSSPLGSQNSLGDRGSATSIEGSSKIANIKGKVFGAISYWTGRNSTSSTMNETSNMSGCEESLGEISDVSMMDISEINFVSSSSEEEKQPTPPSVVINMNRKDCGLPLKIFCNGMLCHPYLSLPYLDLMSDSHVRGFLVGATNVLFKQKPQLSHVLVEIDEGKIEIHDQELRKLLHLTTEDLRFADFIVRHVTEDKEDIFLDGTGWEGGDEWLRAQFKYYLICLLRTSLTEEPNKDLESFNTAFIEAWKETSNYKHWREEHHSAISDITPGHPFQGQLSMADMKLRLSHTMQSSERGRRINQAMANTGRAVVQTSKAFGGAISHAKSAVSSWFLTFSGTPPPPPQQQALQ